MPTRTDFTPTAANRLALDYDAAADGFATLPFPIIDVHSHINGAQAARIYRDVARRYGVGETWTMTKLEEVDIVRDALDGAVEFIAVPNYWSPENRRHEFTDGYADRIEAYHEKGARIVKFWVAPRSRDMAREYGIEGPYGLDAPHRLRAMERATELGMMFMTHVADPDTWFQTRYADASQYGTKREQYEPLEMVLDRFTVPWIAAHMGGWPEDLEFLTGLLERHPNLHLDTSATKWMVRELSRHSRDELITFLRTFSGRILFGSDIVSADEHLESADEENEQYQKATSEAEAYDLYASRYWALRTLWETDYDGESPIADPDLHMIDPEAHSPMDAPALRGHALPADLVQDLYHDAAARIRDTVLRPSR